MQLIRATVAVLSDCLFYIVGPPIIVATHTMSNPWCIYTARFISVPSTYFVEWYISDEVLNISSNNNQTTSVDTITIYMYGVPVAVSGYKAILIIQSNYEVGTDKQIKLVLINELGRSSNSFDLWIGIYILFCLLLYCSLLTTYNVASICQKTFPKWNIT